MRIFSSYKELTKTSFSFYEAVAVIIALALIAPFIILSKYNNPSIDDYSFVFNTNTLDFWDAQASWYKIWTGRYASIFLLSAHPLLINSLLVYRLVSILLILFTIHSIYILIRSLFEFSGKTTALILAAVIAFIFFNGMPTLVQGIYWLPGALTYQLGNILLLYITAHVLKLMADKEASRINKFVNSFLIVVACGLNETTMLTLDLLLLSFCCFYVLRKRKLQKDLIIFLLIAICCSLIVVFAPGNAVRDSGFADPNKHQIGFSIISSFTTAYTCMGKWLSSSSIVMASFLAISFHVISSKKERNPNAALALLVVPIWGYLLITSTFISGFWSTGYIAPDRTLNVSYWLFICLWFITILLLMDFLNPLLAFIRDLNWWKASLILLITLLLSIDTSGNYYVATRDIISGKAFMYNKECRARSRIMENSQSDYCEVPSFSVYPRSIFNEDITSDINNWWNHLYALYYNKKGVRVVFKEPCFANSIFFNFESDNNQSLANQNSITNSIAYSLPNSCSLNGVDSYSATYRKSIKEMGIDDITTSRISIQLYSTDSLVNAVLVFCINDPLTKKDLLWKGKEIIASNYVKNSWVKEELVTQINKELLRPEYEIVVYVWNRNPSKIFVDDMTISIY